MERRDLQAEAEEALRYQTIELVAPNVVRAYVKDLRQLLKKSGAVEQKASWNHS